MNVLIWIKYTKEWYVVWCVNENIPQYHELLNTMRFSQKLKNVQNGIHPNCSDKKEKWVSGPFISI